MAFWTDHTGQDPKRNFRFIATIGNMPDGATWYCKSAQKPAFTVADVSHSFLNHTFYYPGKVEWQEVEIVMVDPVSPDALANTLSIPAKLAQSQLLVVSISKLSKQTATS